MGGSGHSSPNGLVNEPAERWQGVALWGCLASVTRHIQTFSFTCCYEWRSVADAIDKRAQGCFEKQWLSELTSSLPGSLGDHAVGCQQGLSLYFLLHPPSW